MSLGGQKFGVLEKKLESSGHSSVFEVLDFKSREVVRPNNFIFTGKDGPWEVVVDLHEVRRKLNPEYFKKAPPFVSKYLPFMPIRDYGNFVSLQEGSTALIRSKHIGEFIGANVYFKVEANNPTGSFKDRGSAVELTVARELGAKGISVASTGNMAASCSCYAAAAGIPCFVFVPEDTPPSKLAQAISYGGRIVQVKGGYNDAARLAEEVALQFNFYLAGDYAFRVEGQKTAAFELVDQLFFNLPDMVFVPIGCGTNITGYGKGFAEYKKLGYTQRLPQLVGVQAEGANSVVQAFAAGEEDVTPLESINTMASAIGVTYPLDGIKALAAIRASGGSAAQVSDQEMLRSQYMLSKEEGLFVEASCASTVSAMLEMGKDGELRGKTIVCVLTGDGLKDTTPILRAAIKPPTIYPDVNAFQKLYESSLFEGKRIAFVDRASEVFSAPPEKKDISRVIRENFETEYADSYVERIRLSVDKVLKKGKSVTFSDFQDIVQDIFESPSDGLKQKLEVVDFSVSTAMDKPAQASVKVLVAGEKTREAKGVGTGPVDAVINALRAAVKDILDFKLDSYRVSIRSQGTDALVYVDIRLQTQSGVSLGKGASPDIIQASIEAFGNAYRGISS